MLVEILVFGGKERIDDELRHRLDRQIEPPLLGIFTEQRAIGGVDARHDRRFVILQLGIVGQILGEMPDRAGDSSHADQEHNGSSGKKEADETQEQSHKSDPLVSPLRLSAKCNYTAAAPYAFDSN